MNWLDIVFVIILLGTMILGIVKGLIRQVIGLAAVIIGLVLASLYYEGIAEVVQKLIRDRLLSNFLGFLIIFLCVLAVGALLSHFISKAMKGPLAFINRLSGGLFGLLKAVLICGIIVFALTVFGVAREALETSRLAPVCLGVTRAAVNLIPQDLKTKFNQSYKEIRQSGGKHGEKI
jgi:membrane protein required for colicin V production